MYKEARALRLVPVETVTALAKPRSDILVSLGDWCQWEGRKMPALGMEPKCLLSLYERYFSLSLPHYGKTRNWQN
jgi:hypothetical protein